MGHSFFDTKHENLIYVFPYGIITIMLNCRYRKLFFIDVARIFYFGCYPNKVYANHCVKSPISDFMCAKAIHVSRLCI